MILIHNEPEQQQEGAQEVVEDNLNLNVVIPQINHWENFLHHEIPEDDLMLDAEDEDLENQQNLVAQQQNLAA